MKQTADNGSLIEEIFENEAKMPNKDQQTEAKCSLVEKDYEDIADIAKPEEKNYEEIVDVAKPEEVFMNYVFEIQHSWIQNLSADGGQCLPDQRRRCWDPGIHIGDISCQLITN